MNEWLTPVIDAFVNKYGKTNKPIVWEVGSRDGHDAVELAQRIHAGENFWRESRIVCLEPNPDQVKVIHENYPNVWILDFAASDVDGTADFTVYHGDEGAVGSSSLNHEWKQGLENHVITVETKRLENLVDEDIDIMKIDTEGFSAQVLRGLGDKLRNVKVYHIETEEWHKTDEQVKQIMSEAGYELADERQQYAGMPDLTFRRNN